MATFTKQILSGSTNGRGIKVAATSSAGTLIHTAPSSDIDEVWIYAMNTDSASKKLTLEWGGTTSPDDLIEITLDAEPGLVLIVPGLPVTGSVAIRAFAASANVVTIHGYANRIA